MSDKIREARTAAAAADRRHLALLHRLSPKAQDLVRQLVVEWVIAESDRDGPRAVAARIPARFAKLKGGFRGGGHGTP